MSVWGPHDMSEWTAGVPLWGPEGLAAQRLGHDLTWDVDVHGHDAVTAPHDGV